MLCLLCGLYVQVTPRTGSQRIALTTSELQWLIQAVEEQTDASTGIVVPGGWSNVHEGFCARYGTGRSLESLKKVYYITRERGTGAGEDATGSQDKVSARSMQSTGFHHTVGKTCHPHTPRRAYTHPACPSRTRVRVYVPVCVCVRLCVYVPVCMCVCVCALVRSP